jgi:hypothetical protein
MCEERTRVRHRKVLHWLAKSQIKGEFSEVAGRSKMHAASEVAKVTSLLKKAQPIGTAPSRTETISVHERGTRRGCRLCSQICGREWQQHLTVADRSPLVDLGLWYHPGCRQLVPSSSCRCPGSRPLDACRKAKE